MIKLLYLAPLVVFALYLAINLVKRERISRDYCIGYFGTMGSGKTFMGVKTVRQRLKSFQRWQKWVKRVRWWIPVARCIPAFHRAWKRRFPEAYQTIEIYSTIPMSFRLRYSLFRKRIYSAKPLTVQHLLCYDKLPQNSIIYIGEFGKSIASQFDYDNCFVQLNLANFISFCRHWFLGKFGVIVIDEQAPSCVTKEVRVRLGTSYVLSGCHVGKLFPFYRVQCAKLDFTSGDAVKSDNDQQVVTDENSPRKLDKGKRFFWGFNNPFRREYDTRCYSEIYTDGFTIAAPESFSGMKTNYLPIMPNNAESNKQFKSDRTIARQKFGCRLRTDCTKTK